MLVIWWKYCMHMLFSDNKSKNSNQRYVGRMQTHIHCGLIQGKFQWLLSWGIPCLTSICNMHLFVPHSWLVLLTLQKLQLCFCSHTMLICYCTCGNELLKAQGRWITHLPPANSPSLHLFSCCRISENVSKGKVIHPRSSDKRSALTPEMEGNIWTEESQWCCLSADSALALLTMLVLTLLCAFFEGECF